MSVKPYRFGDQSADATLDWCALHGAWEVSTTCGKCGESIGALVADGEPVWCACGAEAPIVETADGAHVGEWA